MEAMADKKKAQGGGETAYSNTDWETYAKSRPPYPQSLVQLIYAHHREGANPRWEKLVDIGSGNGIAVTSFARDFQVVHLSDPGISNVEKATDLISAWLAENNIHLTIESSQSIGEETHKHAGNADMVICATAAHFMDPDGLAASIAQVLRPGGTMAVFSYWWPTFPRQSKNFNDQYVQASVSIMSYLRKNSDGLLNASIGNVLMRVWSGDGGLEFFPIPSDKFESKKRIIINASNREMLFMKAGADKLLHTGEAPVPSRVQQDDEIVRLETGTDEGADGWGFNVNKSFLFNFLQTMRPAGGPMSDNQFDDFLAGFGAAFDAECPSGEVYALWPVNIALGTRK